ncbi:MAG: hypothetical protein JW873_06030 [Candidatus Saganbacteria bacterium]|nr:hypothetical protein [Candidatus Saganbacteria bacterium]
MTSVKWYHRPPVVLALLFVVLGPFALPLLYQSPAFNRTWKFILTIAVLALAGALFAYAFEAEQAYLNRLFDQLSHF